MSQSDTRRQFQTLRNLISRLEADAIDRELHPELYQETPTVWIPSDLTCGDAQRDEGKKR